MSTDSTGVPVGASRMAPHSRRSRAVVCSLACPRMPLGDYLGGLALLPGTWGAAGYIAAVVERRRLPRLDPVPRVLALALLFLAALLASHLIPGMLGVLEAWTVTLIALLGALAASRIPVSEVARQAAPTPPGP